MVIQTPGFILNVFSQTADRREKRPVIIQYFRIHMIIKVMTL
jgi:hypothetical protein